MKHIFKRELAAFLAAAAVLGGILAGATHYLTRPSPTAMWYLPYTGKIPV